jgi:DNA polymerase III epsilon subunit-like protein
VLDLDGSEIDHFDADMLPDPFPDTPAVRDCLAYLGVERAQIDGAEPAAQVLARFTAWWEGHNRPLVSAFNAPFDRDMLKRAGWRQETYWGRCVMRAAWTIMDADPGCPGHRWDNGDLKYPSLAEACAYYGVEQVQPAHRALSDARTAGRLAVEMQRRALARRAERQAAGT